MVINPDAADRLPTYKKAMIQAVAYKRIRGLVSGVLKHFDLNTTQWIILGVLYESATGLKITDIARSLEVEVPLITRLSRTLLDAGLIKENRSATVDRRTKPLALTERGRALVSRVEQELTNRMQKVEEGLTEREVKRYFRTLEAFTDNTSV